MTSIAVCMMHAMLRALLRELLRALLRAMLYALLHRCCAALHQQSVPGFTSLFAVYSDHSSSKCKLIAINY
eukprot:1025336-Pelagomonas_calceolata.AAC.3